MEALIAIASVVAMLAALGALVFAWLTVHDARAARREEAERREVERLHALLELVGAIGESENASSQRFGVLQLRLGTALRGMPKLPACLDLSQVDQPDAFEAFLEARDEIERALAGRPR